MLLADKFLCYYEIKANWYKIKVLAYISFKVWIITSLIFFYNDIESYNKKGSTSNTLLESSAPMRNASVMHAPLC